MAIIFALFEAWWRRWFGGAYIGGDKWEDKWFNCRGFQHAINCVLMGLFMFYEQLPLIKIIYAVAVISGLYWAKGHPSLDMGRKEETEEDKKRYEKVWFYPIVAFLVPESEHHKFGFDFIWHSIRYIYPAVLASFVLGYPVLLAGISIAWVYSFFASLYERIDTSKLPNWLDRANKPSEIVSGFISGLCFFL